MIQTDLLTADAFQKKSRQLLLAILHRRKRITHYAGWFQSKVFGSFRGSGYFCAGTWPEKQPKGLCAAYESAEVAPAHKPSDYQQQLQSTLLSLRKDHQRQDADCAVLASFDAATIGRLAVTYYNEISLKTFLERMHDWDVHCCWRAGNYGIQVPNLIQIVDYAFGIQRGKVLETDDRIQCQHLQRLLNCKISGGVFPLNILKALT